MPIVGCGQPQLALLRLIRPLALSSAPVGRQLPEEPRQLLESTSENRSPVRLRCPVTHLAQAYFHQDYDLDAPTAVSRRSPGRRP